MKIGIIATVIIIGIVVLWIMKTKGQDSKQISKTKYNRKEAEKFVKRIEELGYFKYAVTTDLENLKENMVNDYDPNNELTSIWDDNAGTPKDFRYYFCDGETLFEEGGVLELLNALKPTFEKLNFTCLTTNNFEEWDDKHNWLNHKITINRTEYQIFKNFTEQGWGEAPIRIAEILNMELSKQEKEDRVFLACGGNDGRLIFLTDELYKYIYSVYKNSHYKPLDLNEWAKVNEVKPMKLD